MYEAAYRVANLLYRNEDGRVDARSLSPGPDGQQHDQRCRYEHNTRGLHTAPRC